MALVLVLGGNNLLSAFSTLKSVIWLFSSNPPHITHKRRNDPELYEEGAQGRQFIDLATCIDTDNRLRYRNFPL